MPLIPLFNQESDISGDLSASFPMLELGLYGPTSIEATLPSLSLEGYTGGQLSSTFPIISLSIEDYFIAELYGEFPGLTLTSSGQATYNTIDIEFPSLNSAFLGAKTFSAELPSLQLSAEGNAGHAGSITSSFPKLVLVAHTGGQLEEEFSRFAFEMTAVNNVLATISGTLPQLGVAITTSHPSTADLDITLSRFSMALEVTIGIVGSISGTLPKFSMGITALPGATADLEGAFKLLQLTAAGGPSGPGEIEATLPMLELELISGELTSDVLRYDWERIA